MLSLVDILLACGSNYQKLLEVCAEQVLSALFAVYLSYLKASVPKRVFVFNVEIFPTEQNERDGAKSACDSKWNKYINIENREQAICYALDRAGKGDIIAILGKGNEPYQEIDGVKYPYSDYKVVDDYFAKVTQDENVDEYKPK